MKKINAFRMEIRNPVICLDKGSKIILLAMGLVFILPGTAFGQRRSMVRQSCYRVADRDASVAGFAASDGDTL